ncbi:MAG TPA: hypothetical protein VN776_01160, partial [Terracidiphilus sp.]|nr:hypothetical protein [Terracidiphilus sp.]
FSGVTKKKAALDAAIAGAPVAVMPVAAAPPPAATSSADDYEAFLKLLHEGGKRPFRKPGISVKQEFELWAAAQAKARATAAARASRAAATAAAATPAPDKA